MLVKRKYTDKIREYLSIFPAVGIIGSRQVGKTTLVKHLNPTLKTLYLDLESNRDINKLSDPETFLIENQDKLIIIDEIQRRPDLFPLLRSIIDKKNKPGMFILLGSASPELIRDSSESLAGRIGYITIHPFNIQEINEDIDNLWIKGGYPRAYLSGEKSSHIWKNQFIQTYIEKDIPLLGLKISPKLTDRLWTMLAHLNGQIINYSLISKSLELSSVSIKSYVDFFEQAFLARRLYPYTLNISKRLVKSPKIYFIDTGLLHNFLNIRNKDELLGHPKFGDSWEAFCLQQIISSLPDSNFETCFFKTQDGSEIDMVILVAGKPFLSIEIKYSNAPKLSKGNLLAIQYLKTKHNFVITPSSDDYPLNKNIRVTSINKFIYHYIPNLLK